MSPFSVKDWRNYPDVSTPITAVALEDMEGRLSGYTDALKADLVTNLADFPLAPETDYSGAIPRAIAATPPGGFLFLADGELAMDSPAGPECIAIKDKPVHLIGQGGTCQANSSTPFIREAGTKITSTANVPIVHVYETNYTSIESQGSSIRDIAFEGSLTAGAAQYGIWLDNRGTNCRFSNVMVAGCGSHGIVITDSVGAIFDNVHSHHNAGDGWLLDSALGTDAANAAVTNNLFLNCQGNGNTGNGIKVRGDWGNVWLGGDCEGNTGYGFLLDAPAGAGARFNRTVGVWLELNTAGSLRLQGSVSNNDLDFVRVDVTPTFASAALRVTNEVHYNDLSLVGGQRKTHQFAFIRGGALNSSDMVAVVARESDDSGDGRFRASSFVSTFGVTMDPEDELPATIPPGVDMICGPDGRGWTVQVSGTNRQVIVPSGGVVYLGHAAGAIPVNVQDDLQVEKSIALTPRTAASTANSRLFVDSADGKLKFKDSGGVANALY